MTRYRPIYAYSKIFLNTCHAATNTLRGLKKLLCDYQGVDYLALLSGLFWQNIMCYKERSYWCFNYCICRWRGFGVGISLPNQLQWVKLQQIFKSVLQLSDINSKTRTPWKLILEPRSVWRVILKVLVGCEFDLISNKPASALKSWQKRLSWLVVGRKNPIRVTLSRSQVCGYYNSKGNA